MTDEPHHRPSPKGADSGARNGDPKIAEGISTANDPSIAKPGSLAEAARTAAEPTGAAREAIDRATAPVGTDEER